MFVARFSPDIQGDLERGWSAPQGTWSKSAADAAEYVTHLQHDDEDDAEFVSRMIDEGLVRETGNPALPWAVWHADGLSAYLITDDGDEDIESAESAMRLFDPSCHDGSGSGDCQAVFAHRPRLIGEIQPGCYLLECDEYDYDM